MVGCDLFFSDIVDGLVDALLACKLEFRRKVRGRYDHFKYFAQTTLIF